MLTFPAEGKLFLGGLINKCGGKVLQGCYLATEFQGICVFAENKTKHGTEAIVGLLLINT